MFKIVKKSNISKARAGKLKTPHGVLDTPSFLPDATRGVIKHISVNEAESLGLGAMVVNTFHLYLSPGHEKIKKYGGIHKFMDWHKPLLSDSGGYQVFSLLHRSKDAGKITDKGVVFKSPLNGSNHEFTPESSMCIQFDLGTDIIVLFDDCPPNDYDRASIAKSVDKTIDWAKRCKSEYDKQLKKRKIKEPERPLLMGVIQGGIFKEERKRCADALNKIGFDGLGFGARPVDAEGNFLFDILSYTAELVPENNFRFGLGIGTPDDIVRCIAMGWDLFDCVIPTRDGRHGRLFYFKKGDVLLNKKFVQKKFYEAVNILNSKYANNKNPINKESLLPELRRYSKGYLHHLFKNKEPLGARLASLHNLEFYIDLMNKARKQIISGKL